MVDSNTASVNWKELDQNQLCLVIKGRLDVATTGSLWEKILKIITKTKPQELLVDASQIKYCDGAGIGLLLKLTRCIWVSPKRGHPSMARSVPQSVLEFCFRRESGIRCGFHSPGIQLKK